MDPNKYFELLFDGVVNSNTPLTSEIKQLLRGSKNKNKLFNVVNISNWCPRLVKLIKCKNQKQYVGTANQNWYGKRVSKLHTSMDITRNVRPHMELWVRFKFNFILFVLLSVLVLVYKVHEFIYERCRERIVKFVVGAKRPLI